MDSNELREHAEGQNKIQEEFKKRTTTLYSREKGREISLDEFSVLKVLGAGAFGTVLLVNSVLYFLITKKIFTRTRIRWERGVYISRYFMNMRPEEELSLSELFILAEY